MIKKDYENLDELIDDIKNHKLKLTEDNYSVLLKTIEDLTYCATTGQYDNWDEVLNILIDLEDIAKNVIVIYTGIRKVKLSFKEKRERQKR